jgi:Tfp pilus assembly protein PilO
MLEQVLELLKKIPPMLLLAVVLGYLGYDYYEFQNDPLSALNQKQGQVDAATKQSDNYKDTLKKAKEFYLNLEKRRAELRELALELEQIKVTLSEEFDMSAVIKSVVAEAGKVGLTVSGMKPTDLKESEYYTEQSYTLNFHAVYVQLVVFLDRLANLDRIIRVDQFDVKTSSAPTAQYVELEGTLLMKTYRYKGSKADELGKDAGTSLPKPVAAPAPGGHS